MKKLLYLVLGLYSITCFGQSDLEIQPIYVANGLTSAPNFRHNHVRWSFDAINNGTTEAGIVSYTIYLSEDNALDPNDLIVHTGSLGDDNLNSPSSGIDANSTVQVPSYLVTEEDFYIPWNYEANEEYFFIFKIDQDINGGEVNIANNISVLPFYLTLDNKLKIQHVDYTVDLGNKTPLLLVHGWQPFGFNAEGGVSIWDNFLAYFNSKPELYQNFKPYYVKYSSNIVPVNDLGHELRIDLDNWFGTDYTGNISIVAHSMGGLVSRSFMNRTRNIGPHAGHKGGDRVNLLITLGTPHHGSHMANGEIRVTPTAVVPLNAQLYVSLSTTVDFSESLDAILEGYYQINSNSLPDSQSYNRWDLRWDNFDTFFDYTNNEEEINEWLNSSLMNADTTFDNKIITYVGEVYHERNILTDISVQTLAYYHLGEQFLSNLYYVNDGIVPRESAEFKNHSVNKKRIMYDYYHDEMAKGRFDYIVQNNTDFNLFGLIEADLRGNVSNSIISSSIENAFNYPETAISNNSTKEIVIGNTGDLELTINSIQIIGVDNTEFSFNFPTVPFNIQPNETDTFTIDFAPTTIGDKSVVFRINNSSVNNPQLDIQLSGLAVETATTDYNTNANATYDFGNVYIYGETELMTLNVSNSSSAPYTVSNLSITGTNANLFSIVQQPVLPKVFNPGDSDVVVLSFDPDTVGNKIAVIEASFENSSVLDTANLIGNGVNEYTNPNAPKLTLYEYWFNEDYLNKHTITLSGQDAFENLSFDADFTGLQNNGLNTFHFRAKDENGAWSSVLSEFVYVQNASNANGSENIITEYEYWFDDNYLNRVTGVGNDNSTFLLDLSDNVDYISLGLHQFHIRFKDSKGAWSSVLSEFIYRNGNNESGFNDISEYRYWFNQDFTSVVSGTVSLTETLLFVNDIDVSSLAENSVNYIHFQFKDTFGNWSSVLTEEFLFETLSIEDENQEKLKLYPNPTNSKIFISTTVLDGSLSLYNNLGQLVVEYDNIPNEINLSNLESGLYFIELNSDNKTYHKKIIKY